MVVIDRITKEMTLLSRRRASTSKYKQMQKGEAGKRHTSSAVSIVLILDVPRPLRLLVNKDGVLGAHREDRPERGVCPRDVSCLAGSSRVCGGE